jgi:hypothetical protein
LLLAKICCDPAEAFVIRSVGLRQGVKLRHSRSVFGTCSCRSVTRCCRGSAYWIHPPCTRSPSSGSGRSETLVGETAGVSLRVEIGGRPPSLPERVSPHSGLLAPSPLACLFPFEDLGPDLCQLRRLDKCNVAACRVLSDFLVRPARRRPRLVSWCHGALERAAVPVAARVLLAELEECLGQELRQRGLCCHRASLLLVQVSQERVLSGSAAMFQSKPHRPTRTRFGIASGVNSASVSHRGVSVDPQKGSQTCRMSCGVVAAQPQLALRWLSRTILRRPVRPGKGCATTVRFIIRCPLFSGRRP